MASTSLSKLSHSLQKNGLARDTEVQKTKAKIPKFECKRVKVKFFSILVGPGADPGVQAVSPQVTLIHPPGGRLPLLSAGPAVTFPAEERHSPPAGTKLDCLVTEAHAQDCYLEADRPIFEPATFWANALGL